MRVIIDGYNLIRKVPVLLEAESLGLEMGRRRLLDYLSRYQKSTRHRVTVVFDGTSGRESSGGVDVRFHSPADDLIVKVSQPGTLVVTSDREVSARAKDRGALTCESEEFGGVLVSGAADSFSFEEEEYPRERERKGGNPRRLSKKAREQEREKKRVRKILEGRR